MDFEKFAPGGPGDLLSIGQRMLDPIIYLFFAGNDPSNSNPPPCPHCCSVFSWFCTLAGYQAGFAAASKLRLNITTDFKRLGCGRMRAPSVAPTHLENISWPSIQLSYLGSQLGLFLSITITYYNYLITLISWDRPHLFVKPSPCHEPLSFPSRDSGPATRCLGRPFCNASWCHLASSSRILPIDGAGNIMENR